jgi:hypothetical protein
MHKGTILNHDSKGAVGVLLKNGDLRFVYWGGFTLEMHHPVKLFVHQYSRENEWNPRSSGSKMPVYTELKPGEFLVGSWSNDYVYAMLPFLIVEGKLSEYWQDNFFVKTSVPK